MKNFSSILLGLFFVFISLSVNGQEETLFSRGSSVGGFMGIITEVGSIDGETRTSIGGGVGLVIDNMFLGAYGIGSADYERWLQGDDSYIDIAHGGLWLGYNYKTYKLYHLYSSVKLGWGAVGIDTDREIFRNNDIDGIFVVTPEVGIELNVAKWFRLAGTLGYRIVDGVESDGFTNSDFSGVNLGITMRFGWFGRKRGDY